MSSPNGRDTAFDDQEAVAFGREPEPSAELEGALQVVLRDVSRANGAASWAVDSESPSGNVAVERVRWLRRCLAELGERPTSVLDFACSAGVATPHFFSELRVRSFLGVGLSREQIVEGERWRGKSTARFVHLRDFWVTEAIDLAYVSGVFRRMPERARAAAAVLIFRSLSPGGLLALWERNPWNPGTRLDSRAAHGELNPSQAGQVLRGAGFDIVHTTSSFYFPSALSWFRPIEPMLSSLPLGREYMVLARRP